MPVLTSLRLLEGRKRDGSTVQVLVGRSVTCRAVLAIGDRSVELNINNTLGLIIAASEVLRASGIDWGGQQ